MFNKTFILENKMKILNKVKLASAIESRAKEDLALCNIGGASVLVWQSGEVVYKNHFGAASLDGNTLSFDTLFRMASTTPELALSSPQPDILRSIQVTPPSMEY